MGGLLSKLSGRSKSREVQALQAQLETFKRREEETEVQIASLKKSLSEAQDEIKSKNDRFARQQVEMEKLRRESDNVRRQSQAVQETDRQQIAKLSREVQDRKEDNNKVMWEREKLKDLLEARTVELQSAQTFLGKADRYSGKELLQQVEKLNADIYQTAAHMAESFKYESADERAAERTEEDIEAFDATTEVLGEQMATMLETLAHHEDPIVVQMALQAAMCAYGEWIISSWFFQEHAEEHVLADIYERLRNAEDQNIAGRWRALTRLYAQQHFRPEPDILLSHFLRASYDILLVAGAKYDSTTGGSEVLYAELEAKFHEQLLDLIRSTTALNKMIGEDVISAEFLVIFVHPGVEFEGETMEDMFSKAGAASPSSNHRDKGKGKQKADPEEEPSEHSGSPSPRAVLCTTDIGLMRGVRNGEEWQHTILLKPKVVLKSGLDEILSGDGSREPSPEIVSEL